MTLMIYNSLSRGKEAFTPLDPVGKAVTFYSCGPTVYDHFHLGNARTFVMNDLIRRYLALAYQVRFVQNLTDVDDKIIDRAKREDAAFDEIRTRYIAAYFDDAEKLRIRSADLHPLATEHIPQMIELMKRLESKGFAYAAGGSLYYRVRRFPEYGKLSGRDVDELRQGARVEVNEAKEDPLDFVMWKAAKPGEPKWPSPWGEGRPGWHLECSAMAMALLGETLDIHAGGCDLMFPHHENEIAQSEGATGLLFARYWLHNGYLTLNKEKMSKSVGNVMEVEKALAEHGAAGVRFFLMSAHYRNPLELSEEALTEAAAAMGRINEGIDTAEKILRLAGRPQTQGSRGDLQSNPDSASWLARFNEAMDDDFNTPKALAVMHDAVTRLHEILKKRPLDEENLAATCSAARWMRDFFSLEPEKNDARAQQVTSGLRAILDDVESRLAGKGLPTLADTFTETWGMDALLARLIDYRKLARKQKAYEVADVIRDDLGRIGIALEDHPHGTIWKMN